MGYNSELQIETTIKKSKIEEFRTLLKNKLNNHNVVNRLSGDSFHGYWMDYFLQDLEITDDGELEYPEYDTKWYDSEKFALFIKEYVEAGYIKFIGEDGERWGYYFDGEGKLFNLVYTEEIGKEIKG